MSAFEVRRYKGFNIYRVCLGWYVFDGPSWFHKHFTNLRAAKAWVTAEVGPAEPCDHGVCRRFRQMEYATGAKPDESACLVKPESR